MSAVRRRARLAAAVLVALLATGCSDLQGTNGKQWITGRGEIVQIEPAQRGAPVSARGTSLDGSPLDLADYRGKVVVLNVWASWCGPCRTEMPTVVDLAKTLDSNDISVLGVNVRDSSTATSQAFARDVGIDFPSFYDPGSEVLLSLSDKIGPYSLPSTAVLDRQGRLAALVLGSIPGAVTMRDVVEAVAHEHA